MWMREVREAFMTHILDLQSDKKDKTSVSVFCAGGLGTVHL